MYGYPDGSWEVNLPDMMAPTRLPQLGLGINKDRDGMQKKQWLSSMAVPSDSWLLMVAFNFSARFGFGKSERRRLFEMIDDLPSVAEAVNEVLKTSRGQLGNNKSNKRKSSEKKPRESKHPNPVNVPILSEEVAGENEEVGQGESLHGTCNDAFWIRCDMCERWFHSLCKNVTASEAELFEQYKCPSCSRN